MMEYIVHDEPVRYGPNLVANIRVASGEDLVRCRDCKFSYIEKFSQFDVERTKCGGKMNDTVRDNGFCAWGERRAER